MKIDTDKKIAFRWPMVVMAIIGLYGLYGSTMALIERDYVLWVFWLIVGGIPFTIVGTAIIRYLYARFR